MKKSKNALALAAHEVRARRIVKAALKRQEISYQALSDRLKERGINIGAQALSNRLSRGGFSFAFTILIYDILDADQINLRRV